MTAAGNEAVEFERKVKASINLCVRYFPNRLSELGKFDYIVDLENGQRFGDYNILRHAAPTFELFRLVGSEFDDESIEPLAARAWTYLVAQVVADPHDPNNLCVVEVWLNLGRRHSPFWLSPIV
jgi:hypothetical protein